MKKAIAIILAVMSMSALCAPVRSMLGAQGAINKAETPGGWKNPYITDGLIAMWDGEWNAGPGKHDRNAKKWIDISKHGYDLDVIAGIFEDNYLDCSYATSSSPAAQSTSIDIPDPSHIEVVAIQTNITSEVHLLNVGTPKQWGIYNGSSYSNRTKTPCFGRTLLSQSMRFPDYKTFSGQTYSYNYIVPYGYINGELINFPADHNYDGYQGRRGFTTIGCARNAGSVGYSRILRGVIYVIRLYSRQLTAEEVMHNYLVDKERFNLP